MAGIAPATAQLQGLICEMNAARRNTLVAGPATCLILGITGIEEVESPRDDGATRIDLLRTSHPEGHRHRS